MQLLYNYWIYKKMKESFLSIKNYKYRQLAALFLSLTFLTGCAKLSTLPYNHEYQAKQIQHCDLDATYVVCKNCVEYTKINKFQNYH